MDPDTTMVMAALAAGVSAGVSKTVSSSISDAYALLKARLKKSFENDPKATETWVDYEADPETYEKPLAKQIEATGSNKDTGIKNAAKDLLKETAAAGVRTKYNVAVTGGNVGIIGDHGHVDMRPSPQG